MNKMDQVGVERSNCGGGRDFVGRDCEEEAFSFAQFKLCMECGSKKSRRVFSKICCDN